MAGKRINRRDFVKVSSAATLGAIAFPYVVSSSALGKGGRPPASERIVMGCIGLGGMGSNNMNVFMSKPEVQIVAVCDVHESYNDGNTGRAPAKARAEQHYADQAGKGAYRGCTAYADFRNLLQREDLDAVCIATPDHWHALTSIAAAEAGLDIYCEKPLANSVAEGRAICEAVKRNNVILQTGSHERSNPKGRFACELVRNGRIGKLHTIRINLPCSDSHHKDAMSFTTIPAPEPIPAGLDWDMWLGHTPVEPYTPRRCHFWWRFILAYGGGEMTDRGAHIIDIGQLGNGTDDTGPIEIEATGTHSTTGLYDAFFDYRFVNRYANGVELIGEAKDPRGLKFEGDKGSIFIHIHGCDLEAEPASLLDEEIGDNEIQLGRTEGHHQNFLDCVRSRQQPFAAAEIGHRTATICHLNNIAMLVGRSLKWDPKTETIEDDDEANEMLTPKMRGPWRI